MIRPNKSLLVSALLLSGSSLIMAHLPGRMTGGGSIFQGSLRITHGFELHCSTNVEVPPAGPNNLEINWAGNSFHLETILFGVCTNEGNADPPKGTAFTTYDGAGFGRYNGAPGARASWRFTDFGEPGVDDLIVRLTIVDANGQIVLDLTQPTKLTFGNHQAHND